MSRPEVFSTYIRIPLLQIRPNTLLLYEQFESSRHHNKHSPIITQTPPHYTGELTKSAKKRLKKAISLLVAIAKEKEATNFKTGRKFKFKLNFITLTLPAPQGSIKDSDIKKCLDNWIKRAKRKYKLNSYVWRAERQANQNIHFHIITDTYIHFENIRNDWNACISPLGFIKRFAAKHGHEIPNSTDVHAIKKVKDLTKYFIKYMSKTHKEGDDPIKGKVWDCSQNLKAKDSCTIMIDGDTGREINQIIDNKTFFKIMDSNFTLIFIPPEKFEQTLPKEWSILWNQYLERIRTYKDRTKEDKTVPF